MPGIAMSEKLERYIDQGVGREPADIVLKGGRFFDLVTGELVASDVAICGDRIVGTCGDYQGREEIDVSGRIIVPGFIDTHLHIESSLVTPHEFDRCVLPYGVTTAICDPHEIANVLGTEGIQYFLDSSLETIMDIRVQLSSCVPATHLETSGADLPIERLLPFRDHPKVIGLAEFMNFPGVVHKDPICIAKLDAFQGGHIDGHAPLLRGNDLNGYLAAGIRTEHESTTAEEALEKIRKGMHILVREGSVSKDLHALMPILTERLSPYLALCTGVTPGKIITEHRRYRLPVKGNQTDIDLSNDVIKVAVIERHGKNGNHANGFVQGFGLKKGAIASTVGHDSHNICVVGVNEDDMARAANRLSEINGGVVVVENGVVTGEIALPVAGLMSLEPYESVRDTLHHLRQTAYALGATLEEPFLQLAFLPLPVIPHLKISDRGLVDVDKFMLIG
jgi:adenine deaminase